MSQHPIGLAFFRPTTQALVASVKQAEAYNVPMVWIPSEPVGADGLTALAITAAQTERIQLGTGITVTYTRHPLTVVNEALAISAIAPQRFRLGIGVSHPFVVEDMLGVPFQKPLPYLREYVHILRSMLWNGSVQHRGEFFSVQAALPPHITPPQTPIVLAAVQKNMFKLVGEIADGAMVSWGLLSYMKSVALPALQEGATKAGRPRPRLIGSAPVIFDQDFAHVRQAAYQALDRYLSVPVYQKLFADAGFPLLAGNVPSDELINDMFIYGDAQTITKRLLGMYEAGIDELKVVIYPSQDRAREESAVMELIGRLSQGTLAGEK